jgi:hypothetical protein
MSMPVSVVYLSSFTLCALWQLKILKKDDEKLGHRL